MTKIDLQPIESLTNEQSFLTRINANNTEIEDKSDTFLSRDGTSPNTMTADLDMNSNSLINLPFASTPTEPVRYDQMQALLTVFESAGAGTGSINELFLNVLDYIPTNLHASIRNGTNTTDLAAFIQTAINATPTGGMLWFPFGDYLLLGSGTAALTRNTPIMLRGAGPLGTRLVLAPTFPNTRDVIKIEPTVSWYGWEISGFHIRSAAGTALGRHGIFITSASQGSISNFIYNFRIHDMNIWTTDAGQSIKIDGTATPGSGGFAYATIRDSLFDSINMTLVGDAIEISNCIFAESVVKGNPGIYYSGADGVAGLVVEGGAIATTGSAIIIDKAVTPVIRDVEFETPFGTTHTGTGFFVDFRGDVGILLSPQLVDCQISCLNVTTPIPVRFKTSLGGRISGGRMLVQSGNYISIAGTTIDVIIEPNVQYLDAVSKLDYIPLVSDGGVRTRYNGYSPTTATSGSLGRSGLGWSELYMKDNGTLFLGNNISWNNTGANSSMVGAQTLTQTFVDAGVAGPQYTLSHVSSTPAVADINGTMLFNGSDSTLVSTTYAYAMSTILDPTNASEDGDFRIGTVVAGTLADRLIISDKVLANCGILTSSPTAGIGYSTGAGGAVTQITSKSTGVTLDKTTGQITTHNASLNAAAEVGFTVTNSTVAATDVVVVSIASGATADSYQLQVDATAAGSFRISITNVSAGALGEAIVINFAVIKGVVA